MKILGIDTILHDSCAAVVQDGTKVLSNEIRHRVMSSDKLLELPLLHLNTLGTLIKIALKKANCQLKDISLIAVNNFGSFFSNVMIGVSAANALSKLFDIPLVPVHHQEGHFFSNWLERNPKEFQYPIVVLSASGGHSSIGLILNNRFQFKEISQIEGMEERSENKPNFRGIGAIYGYVASNLGLGGPIDSGRLISEAAKRGNSHRFEFSKNRPLSKKFNLDFSFLEKAVGDLIARQRQKEKQLSRRFICDMAASFEEGICQIIIGDLIDLAKQVKTKEIHLVGGISANETLREKLNKAAFLAGFVARYPKKKGYCTDNAAMIAGLGYWKYKMSPKKYLKQRHINIMSNLKLENMAINQFLERNEELK